MLLELSKKASTLTKEAGAVSRVAKMALGGPRRRAAALTLGATGGLGAYGFSRGMRAQHYDPQRQIRSPFEEAGPLRRAATNVTRRGVGGAVSDLPSDMRREFQQTIQSAGDWQ